MKISEILKEIKYKRISVDSDVEISGICTDSQKVKQGDLFICYVGNTHDSHDYAAEAVRAGAVAVICERELDCAVPQIIVDDGRKCVAAVARAFYGFADKKLKLVAVTGTNGKTTTTYMLESIFK